MSAALDIWLYGGFIGRLSSQRTDHLRFDPTETAMQRWGEDSTVLSIAVLLSIAVPLSPQRRPPADRLRAFFNGLLPEGSARDALVRRFNLRPRDIIGLLRELGEDCAGAVIAMPEDQRPALRPSGYHELSHDELAQLVEDLPTAPLGMGDGPVTRKSLAGVQPKLLLTRLTSGTWAYATDGAPSTHILKPEEAAYPGGAANEAWCMRLARACGLTTVDVEVLAIGDTPVFCVSRYDRRRNDDVIERIHQEDMCQALGIETFDGRAKYGAHNPKRMTLRAFAEILRFHAPDERIRLLAMTAFHIAIGNADAHGKNHSILHHLDGTIELAPIYDAWSTIQYPGLSRTLSLSIDRTFQLDAVTVARLVAEAESWGVGEGAALATVSSTLDRLVEGVADDSLVIGLELAEQFVHSIRERVTSLQRS